MNNLILTGALNVGWWEHGTSPIYGANYGLYDGVHCWDYSGGLDNSQTYFTMATNPLSDITVPVQTEWAPYKYGIAQTFSHPANQVVNIGFITLSSLTTLQQNAYQICYAITDGGLPNTCTNGTLTGSRSIQVTLPISGLDTLNISGKWLGIQYVTLGSNAATPTATNTPTPTVTPTGTVTPIICPGNLVGDCEFQNFGTGQTSPWSLTGGGSPVWNSIDRSLVFTVTGVSLGARYIQQEPGMAGTLTNGYYATIWVAGTAQGAIYIDNFAHTAGWYGGTWFCFYNNGSVGGNCSAGTIDHGWRRIGITSPSNMSVGGLALSSYGTGYMSWAHPCIESVDQANTSSVCNSSISPGLYPLATATPTQTAMPSATNTPVSTPTPVSFDGSPLPSATNTYLPGTPTPTIIPTVIGPWCNGAWSCDVGNSTPNSSCNALTLNTQPPANLLSGPISKIPVLSDILQAAANVVVGFWQIVTDLFIPQHINCDFTPMTNSVLTKVAIPNISTVTAPLQTAVTTPCGYIGVQNIGFNRPNIHTVVSGPNHSYAPTVQVSQPISIGVDGCAAPWITYYPLGRGFIDFAMWVWFSASTLLFIKSFFTSQSFGKP